MKVFNPKRGAFFTRLLLFLSILSLALWTVACGDDAGGSSGDDDDSGDDDSWDGDDDDSSDDDDSGDDDSAGDDDDDEPPPPEPEPDVDPGTQPRICNGAAFVLNTAGDFVSRIDVQTLNVQTVFVGQSPEVLRATDDCTTLVTLNTGDNTVSIIDAADNDVTNLDVRPGLNDLRTSPNGAYALAYHRFQDSGGGTQAYGEISIVDLVQETVLSLAVGFPPDKVLFTTQNRVLLVSETALVLVDMKDGSFTMLPTGLDIDEGQKLKKVAATTDGQYALLLAEASKVLRALDLDDQTVTDIDLGCFPTDLDVAEQGDVSLLLCRLSGQIIVLDNIALTFDTYETDEVVGSGELSSDGELAVLFTNSELIERVHLFTPATGVLETHLTVKPLTGAAIAPGNQSAVLFHYGGDGEPIDEFDAYFDTKQAFSIMNLDDGRINPVQTPEAPKLVAFGDDGKNALVPLPNNRQIVLADLIGGLADVVILPSKPMETGVISDLDLAFVLQDHPMGRISFIDLATKDVRTITGFLLNGGIE